MPYSLQEVSDLIEIDRLITRLTRGIDGHDIPCLEHVLLDDVKVDFSGKTHFSSRTEFMEFVTKLFGKDPLRKSAHCVVNRDVTIDGDRGSASADVLVTNETGKDGQGTTLQANGVVYEFVFSRSPSGWRIESWTTERTWDTDRIVPGGFPLP